VDATGSPAQLSKRVHALLSKRAFHVDVGHFEGMSFPNSHSPKMTSSEGADFAASLLLRDFALDPPGLTKLQRLKEIIAFHPTIVNPTLTK
jgi:hypothetical protein